MMKEYKFKIGDKVIYKGSGFFDMTYDKEYEIIEDNDWVVICDDVGDRFRRNPVDYKLVVENEDRAGNKYRCIKDGDFFVVGDIVTMVIDDKTDCCYYQREDGNEYPSMNYRFELVSDDTPESKPDKPKFKEGNKVKCINFGIQGCGWELNKEFIIDHINDTSSGICYFPKSGSGTYGNSLELVEDTQDKPKFKAGDRVMKVKKTGEWNEIVPLNMTGTIERVGYGKNDYKISYDHDHDGNFHGNDEYLELIEGNKVKGIDNNVVDTHNGLGSTQSVSEETPVKNRIMDTLRKIPSTLKRHLNPNLKAMYKVGFINGDLALTDNGKSEILNYLITTKAVEEAIATVAKDMIKEAKEDK